MSSTSSINALAASVDAYTNSRLTTSASNPYHATLQHAHIHSLHSGLPDIAVSHSQGASLALLTRLAHATNILEIGTLGAYSTIWFASSAPNVHVTTIEIDPHHASVAKDNIAHAGLTDRITLHLGPALDILPRLLSAVQAGERPPFDFVFIDADKQNNVSYFNMALQMVKHTTCIYVDNVVRQGELANANNTDPRVVGSRELVEAVGRDPRVDSVVIQTVGEKSYDGFLMAVVR